MNLTGVGSKTLEEQVQAMKGTSAFATTWTPSRLLGLKAWKAGKVCASPRVLAKSRPATTRMSNVVLAPGQGAQVPGMLSDWVSASSAAAKLVADADRLLGDRLLPGKTMSEIVRDSPAEVINRTDIAQPAIYVASLACWTGMQDLGLVNKSHLGATAGLSLGEYTALVLAEAMSFEEGLELVTLRGKAMQDAAEASSGGMVALIGADEATALEIVAASKLPKEILVAANFNAPGQVVLSGSSASINNAANFASSQMKLRVAKLDVAGAFHSPLMAPAAERLDAALSRATISAPIVPVMSNVTGKPHQSDSIRKQLVEQLTSPVRWANCVDALMSDVSIVPPEANWIELAPGKTLTGIIRKINRKLKINNFAVPPASVPQ